MATWQLGDWNVWILGEMDEMPQSMAAKGVRNDQGSGRMMVQNGDFHICCLVNNIPPHPFACKSVWIKLRQKVSGSKAYYTVQTIQCSVSEKCLPHWTPSPHY